MSCSIYSDYGTYLKTRSTYKAICDLKSQIDEYNLTKGGTIDGDLIIKNGTLTVLDGDTSVQDLFVLGTLTVTGGLIITDLSLTNLDVSENINVGGNVVIDGDLTVSGTTTKINTVNLDVCDNIILLNSGVTGNNTLDTGIILNRGDLSNIFIGWEEDTSNVIFAYTDSSGATTGDVPIQGYADVVANQITVNNIGLEGDITISGEVINGGSLIIGSMANMVDEIYVNELTVSGSTLHIADCDIGFDSTNLTISTSVEVSGNLVVLGDISNNQLNSYDASIAMLDSSVNGIYVTVSDLSGRVAILDSSVNDTNATVSDLSGRVAILDSSVNDTNATVTDLSGRVATIDTSVVTINATVSDLSGRVAVLDTSVNDTNATVTSLSGSIDILNTSVGTLNNKVIEISNNYLRLDGSTPMTGDLSMNFNSIVDISMLRIRNNVDILDSSNNGVRTKSDGLELIISDAPSGITFNYDITNGFWDAGDKLGVSGEYLINNTPVLTSTALGNNITDSSLTSVGTLNSLDVTGDVSINGDVTIHNGGSITMKDSIGRNTYVKGSTLNVISVKNISINQAGTAVDCDLSSLLFSNMDNSNNVFDVSNNRINILDYSGNFKNSFIEIYANVLLKQGTKTVDYTRVFLQSVTDPSQVIRIDTRTLSKDTISNVTYGPNNIITNTDGILNHNYKLRVEKSPTGTGTNVEFRSPFEVVIKQTCLS